MKTEHLNTLGAPLAGDLRVRTEAALARAGLLVKVPAPIAVLHVPVTCSRVGMTYLASGRRDGDTFVVSAAARMPKARSTAQAAPEGAGFFSSIQFPRGWLCPGCRSPHSGGTWVCDCAHFSGALHTCGDSGRVGICACGQSELLHFVPGNGAEVRGSVSTPRATLNSSSTASRPALAPRVPQLLLPGKKG